MTEQKRLPEQAGHNVMNVLKIPLVVDGAMVLSLVVGGTIMWQKLDTLDKQQLEVRQMVVDDRRTSREGSVGNIDRLARIEERLIVLQTDVGELKREMRRRDQ